MGEQHPITSPPELVQQWWEEADQCQADPKTYFDHVATQAARWGSDQELEACCEWLENQTLCGHRELIPSLRRLRRPKPPTLKKQALRELGDAYDNEKIDDTTYDTIKLALEALPNG